MTSLISFSSRNTFSLNLLLKGSVASTKNFEFLQFFLRRPTGLVQRHPTNFLFQLARDLFILMNSEIICIHFRNSQLLISFKITPASLIRNTLYQQMHWSRAWLFHQIPFKSHLMRILLPPRYLLLLLLVVAVVVAKVIVVVEVVVVEVVVVIVIVGVVEVVKSWPGLVNTNWWNSRGQGW